MKHFASRLEALLFCTVLCALFAVSATAADAGIVTLESETTRVMLLSDAVVRVEEKGEHGFEDRISLIAAGRGDFTGVAATTRTEGNRTIAETATYTVRLYSDRGYHADAVEILDKDGVEDRDAGGAHRGLLSRSARPGRDARGVRAP